MNSVGSHSSAAPEPGAADFLERAIAMRQNFRPKRLREPGPSDDDLTRILMAATAAPDHGEIHPWRFIMIPTAGRARLGELFRLALLSRDPLATAEQQQRAADKAMHAPCLLLSVVDLSPKDPHIDLAERHVSLGCAIQNMLLMAQALGFGSGLSSGQAMHSSPLREAFRLGDAEQAVCFVSFGSVAQAVTRRPRPGVTDILTTFSG
jgi:nitroreductase